MQLHQKISLTSLDILNPLITDYLNEADSLSQLFSYRPNLDGVEQAMNGKANFGHRAVLHESLTKQYEGLKLSAATTGILDSLKSPNTFTVCTAHQLCLFTGPSYFIYKILSAVKLCKDLKAIHPDKNFVPVYWMGSEDHDFEEINHAVVYGKKIVWEQAETGAIGNRSLAGIEQAIADLSAVLGEGAIAQDFTANLTKHFTGNKTYGQAFQAWVLEMFADYGLLVLDQNDAQIKALFSSVIKDELLISSSNKALEKNAKFLDEKYHSQANSRPINLFYLDGNIRERIELIDQGYIVVNTSLNFSQAEILSLLEKHPERFSPNVILRPIYQETILPNVAFIGGPGELAYWLQLKDVFKHFQVSQPAILLRDMAVVLPKNNLEKLEEWGIDIKELFAHYDQIAKDIVANESTNELSLKDEKEAIEKLFLNIKSKALAIDKSMERSVESEQQKIFNALENLESKLLRSEKKNFEQKLSQLEKIQQRLLPENTLQERYDNFLPFYLKFGTSSFEILLENFNVFETKLKVLEA